MAKEQPEQQLRLVFQGSIPGPTWQYLQDWYNDLKIWIQAIHPDVTLNGQIMKILEPCCKKRKEIKNNEKNP